MKQFQHVILRGNIYYADLNPTVGSEQIRTIDRSRLREYVGRLDEQEMKKIDEALAISVGLAYKLLADNEIRNVRIGRTYKIPKACVIEYLLGKEMCHIKIF